MSILKSNFRVQFRLDFSMTVMICFFSIFSIYRRVIIFFLHLRALALYSMVEESYDVLESGPTRKKSDNSAFSCFSLFPASQKIPFRNPSTIEYNACALNLI